MNHKQDGTHPVQRYLALLSKVDAFREGLGEPPTQDDLDSLISLGEEAMQSLRAAGL